jgi:hypothetical protein
MSYSILVSSILRFSISETECTTLRHTPSLLASIASMRLFLLTFYILLRGRDLAYNTFVPFNFIPTFLGLEGQSLGNSHYLSGGGDGKF